ncbi:hypothetical protein BJ912DRAFT_660206 [Pholiota molesta]|nr:hypothetical protein BJ912DRAFT_660206 [Pholiota molesta]
MVQHFAYSSPRSSLLPYTARKLCLLPDHWVDVQFHRRNHWFSVAASRWRHRRIQALFMQVGNLSVGYFTIAIAVHTFNSLVMKMRHLSSSAAPRSLQAGFSQGFRRTVHDSLFGWICIRCRPSDLRRAHCLSKLLFIFHILPILLASLLGAILYSLIFLVLRGSLKLRSGVKLTLDPSSRWHASEGVTESYHRFIARLARSMLWYPVAYIVLLIPYAITRLFMVSGFAVPFQAIIFASVCWYTLSVVDVFLLYNTFRVLGPAFDARSVVSTRKSMTSMGNLEKFAPAPSGYAADMKQKIHQYRSESISTLHSADRSISDSSSYSGRHLLPLHHGKETPFPTAQCLVALS